MYLWFYNNNGEKKPVRMSLLNSEYIYLKIISDDDTFSVVKLEMVDEGLSEKRYGQTDCLLIYHKGINKVLSLAPFRCILDEPKVLSDDYKAENEVARMEVQFESPTTDKEIHTLKFKTLSRLVNGKLDNKKTQHITYQFKVNPNADMYSKLETIKVRIIDGEGRVDDDPFEDFSFSFETDDPIY